MRLFSTSNEVRPTMLGPGVYDDPPPVELPRDKGATWFILGLLFVAATVILWRELTRIETAGGALRVTWMVVEAYEWGGKWIPCGISLMCGIGFLVFGIMEWLNCKAHEE